MAPLLPRRIWHDLPQRQRRKLDGRGVKRALGPTTNLLRGLTVGPVATVSVMGMGVPMTLELCAIKEEGTYQPCQQVMSAKRGYGPHQGHPPTEVGTRLEWPRPDPAREARGDVSFPSNTPGW